MENSQLANSSAVSTEVSTAVSTEAPKTAMGTRALIFNAILCLFILLGALNLSLIVELTWEGQATLLGGRIPYLENAAFPSSA